MLEKLAMQRLCGCSALLGLQMRIQILPPLQANKVQTDQMGPVLVYWGRSTAHLATVGGVLQRQLTGSSQSS